MPPREPHGSRKPPLRMLHGAGRFGSRGSDTFDFLVGDRLLLYTDGLVEARDEQGRFFPLEELTQVLRADDLEQALGALVEAVQRHVPGRLNDDMALLLTERLPVGADSAFTRA